MLVVAVVDPNWLLSTTAQSAAALVAIVGGFLVSRLITLNSEREGFGHRLEELSARQAALSESAALLHDHVLSVGTAWFEEYHLELFARQHGQVDHQAAVDDYCPRGVTDDEMVRAAQRLCLRLQRAFSEIESAYGAGPAFPSSEVEALRGAGVAVPNDDESVYRAAGRVLAEERRKAAGIRQAPRGGMLLLPVNNSAEIARQDARIVRQDEMDARWNEIEAERAVVEGLRRSVGQPRGLMLPFGVLAYFGAVGILLPVCLMASRPVSDSLLIRRLVVLAFGSGFLALLVYVGSAVRSLRDRT